MFSRKGKVVVITGASDGIGAASAVAFAKEGCRLVLNGRDVGKLQTVAEKCVSEGIQQKDVHMIRGDITDDSTITSIVSDTIEKFGAVDVLFSNAGAVSQHLGPFHAGGTIEALDEQYRINVRAPYLLANKFIPELSKTKGVIIFNSSVFSTVNDPAFMAYSCTKAALDHFARSLALAVGMKGIRVNTINCGTVHTSVIKSILTSEEIPLFYADKATKSPLEQKLASPEDIANVAVYLASDKSAAVTGAHIICDKGSSLPNLGVDFTQYA